MLRNAASECQLALVKGFRGRLSNVVGNGAFIRGADNFETAIHSIGEWSATKEVACFEFSSFYAGYVPLTKTTIQQSNSANKAT